jgi:hypothetical protein
MDGHSGECAATKSFLMKTFLRYFGLFLNFLTPYLGTFIFFGKAIDYFRLVFTMGLIVVLARFEYAFVSDDATVADLIFILIALVVIGLFVHSVHVSIRNENNYDFDKFDFFGRIVIAGIPYIAATMILGEMGWLD